MRLGAFLLVLAVLAAGCTAPSEPTRPPSSRVDETEVVPLALAPPDRVVRAPLDVSVDLSDRWIKPLRSIDVAMEAPEAARAAWFVELEGTEPRATTLDGEVFVLKSTTRDPRNAEGPRATVTVPPLAADGRARVASIERAGRYTFDAQGAELTINAWPNAPAGAAQAFLVDDAGVLRFEPPEVDVAPGTRVLLWSQTSRAVEVRETRFAAFVPLSVRDGSLTPVDEGLWRLIALAVQGDARGTGSATFLVDFERPSDRLTVGPIYGDVAVAEVALDPPREIAFRAEHPLETFVLAFAAHSNAPVPASIVVALYREGALLAESSSLEASELAFVELPAGKYEVEVRAERGALVGYEVSGEGRYRLPTPERLRESTR